MENENILPTENKELEQFFFTEKVLEQITNAFEYEDNILCLCTHLLQMLFGD